jgi:SAM-dependent methyltransferase
MATHRPRLCHVRQWLTDMRDHDSDRLSGTRFFKDPAMLSEAVRGSMLIYRHVRTAGLTYADVYVRTFVDDLRLMHNKCREYGLLAEADACAEVVLEATGASDPGIVGEYTVRAGLEPQIPALRLKPGEAQVCPVVVTNRSSVSFHGGECASELSYHLLEADGTVLRFDNPIRVLFDHPLAPGESRTVDLWIRAPNVSGMYYVELDVLWAGCTWLNSIGGAPAFVKLLVGAPAPTGRWWLHAEPQSDASLEHRSGDDGGVRVQIHAAPGGVAWHIQLNYGRVSVTANQRYVVAWEGRADADREMNVAVSRAYDPWDTLGLYQSVAVTPDWRSYQVEFVAAATDDRGRVHFDMGASATSIEIRDIVLRALDGEPIASPPFATQGRLQMDIGVEPLSYRWGTDRGLPVHRYYLEQFLAEHASDVHGHVLEFQDPQYVRRFGGARVTALDSLHIDDSNPEATLVADLTKPNSLAGDRFDCIICTHVLHMIADVPRALRELCRLLKEGGVLLVAVPHVSMFGAPGEIWRFTPLGLESLLSQAFGPDQVTVRSYGNSLTAAGEIRGTVATEFLRSELEQHDRRFAVEICARATKRSGR